MTDIKKRLQKKVYESKTARDILDEEFTEFLPRKRNTNEFFDIYLSKFYKITTAVHKFFTKTSLKYVTDYINPKQLQLQVVLDQIEDLIIEIDSIEKHHPIIPNNTVLQKATETGTPTSEKLFWLLQSGKKRKIKNLLLLAQIKEIFRIKNKTQLAWTMNVPSNTLGGIPSGPDILTKEDIIMSIYQVNTGKKLPSNIYTG